MVLGVGALLLLGSASALATRAPERGTAGGPLTSISVIKTITVGSKPTQVLYDPSNHDIYVANSGASTVSVISSSTNAVTKTVTVGQNPEALLYDPTNQEVYVLNSGPLTVTAITGSNTVSATVGVHGNFDAVPVYDPANGDIYVLTEAFVLPSHFYYNLTRIAHATNLATVITVGSGPNFAVYDNASTEVLVSDEASGRITAVNSSTNSVSTITLKVGKYPYPMIYDPANKEVYVLDLGSGAGTGNITAISRTNTILATVKVGVFPAIGSVDPANGDLLVLNLGAVNAITHQFPATKISVISTANRLLKTLTVGHEALSTSYSPATKDLYVPCYGSNLTYVISASTFAIVGKLTTKQYPEVALYDPARSVMLVAGNSNATGTPVQTIVTVISSTNSIAAHLTLGKGFPGGGAYAAASSEVYVSNRGGGTVSVIQ